MSFAVVVACGGLPSGKNRVVCAVLGAVGLFNKLQTQKTIIAKKEKLEAAGIKAGKNNG